MEKRTLKLTKEGHFLILGKASESVITLVKGFFINFVHPITKK